METKYQYPVFFECHSFICGQRKKKVESHFRVRRKSGGGDCGALTSVADNVYKISFRFQKDQQEVLRRSEHVVELSDGRLVLSVTDSLSPAAASHSTDSAAPAETSQPSPDPAASPSGEEHELHDDEHLPSELKEWLDAEELEKSLTSLSCSAQPHPEDERDLVRTLAPPEALDEVSYWEDEVDSLFDDSLEGHEGNPHERGEHQVRGERAHSTADRTVEQHSQVNTGMLDEEDELYFRENLSEGNMVVASYSLCDGLQVVLCQGDITTLSADALVNSANEDLNHCEGVAAALSQAGGPEVQSESDDLIKHKGKIPTGEVVVTTGGNLHCKRLLHAVGPVGGKAGGAEKILLERTVRRALSVAEMMRFKSIAVPCISSGVFGVPVTVCSEAIVAVVKEFGVQGGRSLSRIILIDDRGEAVRAMQEACDWLLLGKRTENPAQSGDPARGAPVEVPKGTVSVEIVRGTIETQQADALVSPMVGHDPLSTRIGNVLNKTAGSQLTAMFRQETGDETLPGDSVLVEGLSGLPSNAVFFLNLAPWDEDESGTPVQVLRLGINNMLTSCDERGFGSVALPVLGAGVALRFPDSLVAQVLLEQIHSFEQNRTGSTPIVFRIVIHPDDDEAEEVFRSVQEALKHKTAQNTENDPRPDQSQESITKRIVLLGKTGSGKSHLANTILGEELFTCYHSPNSGTQKVQAETKSVNGRGITLIDTPGFFDTDRPEDELQSEIVSCITECAPGPHAFLIVLKVDKYTKQEQQVIAKICDFFSHDALNYAAIVFTHGDDLKEGMTIEEFVCKNEKLRDLARRCGGRCHVFDNKHWNNNNLQNDYRSNQFQLEALLHTLDKMVTERNGAYYTNEFLQHVEGKIQMQEKQIRASSVNLPPEEIRKQAKAKVSEDFWVQLAGTATGALLGAFFGVRTLVQSVLKVMGPSEIQKYVKKVKSATPLAAAAGGEVGALAVGAAVVGLTVAAAAAGVMGGIEGHKAAKGAETPMEAVKRAAETVMEKKNTLLLP